MRIKFKTFKTIYELNPGRWKLYSDWVIYYKGDGEERYKGYLILTKFGTIEVKCEFNFFDRIRYRNYKKKVDKQKEIVKEIEFTTHLIKTAHKDIEILEAKSKKELEKANEVLKRAAKGE